MRTCLLVVVICMCLGVCGCKPKSEQVMAPAAKPADQVGKYQGGELNANVPPAVRALITRSH